MDKLTKEQRSKNMRGNKSVGTKPELLLAKSLWSKGHRYRKNSKKVFGRPDFTFKKIKLAIFVDGEFWHGKDWPERKGKLKTNRDFWIKKIERNIERDQEVNKELTLKGWKILRFWSADIMKKLPTCVAEIENIIKDSKINLKTEISIEKFKESAFEIKVIEAENTVNNYLSHFSNIPALESAAAKRAKISKYKFTEDEDFRMVAEEPSQDEVYQKLQRSSISKKYKKA